MAAGRERTEIAEGRGRLVIDNRNESYSADYYVEFTRDIIAYRSGGVEKTLPGAEDFSGHLRLTDSDVLPYYEGGSATLALQDGRRLRIVLLPRSSAAERLEFLGNGLAGD